ncbi:AAA family ATPase [Promicromonospora vindobonensis]|uniref:AAA family ATPase n=1 Tax=Promicromonospora vindobonensis TaxID=195748 RepID=A0ABW5VYA1_9MICO
MATSSGTVHARRKPGRLRPTSHHGIGRTLQHSRRRSRGRDHHSRRADVRDGIGQEVDLDALDLWAEASRQTLGWRFASVAERGAVTARIVEIAKGGSIELTPGDLAPTPATLQRPDGTTRLRPRHHTVFTSAGACEAEERLLDLAEYHGAPRLSGWDLDAVVGRSDRGRTLTGEQARAVTAVATSGRTVDLLVGPAGAGKTIVPSQSGHSSGRCLPVDSEHDIRIFGRLWEVDHGVSGALDPDSQGRAL